MITVNVLAPENAVVSVSGATVAEVDVLSTVYYGGGGGEPYTGAYDVTPSMDEQILPTRNKTMLQDVVVHKIPPNYGLITYNGYEIMVS